MHRKTERYTYFEHLTNLELETSFEKYKNLLQLSYLQNEENLKNSISNFLASTVLVATIILVRIKII